VIYEDTRAYEVREETPCKVHTVRGTVVATHVVVATNFPVYDPAMYSVRLAPYRDYAIAVQIDGDLPSEMSIGASDSSYSFRTHGDLLIVSGEMHKVGQADTASCFERLEAFARKTFQVVSVPYKWSTQDCMSLDRMPYIGPISASSKNVFVATGFSGWGMSTSAYAGKITADLVSERENSWAATFDPYRWQNVTAVKTFVKEAFNVAQRWFGDKIWNQEDADIDALEPDEAAILPLDGEKVAAYRDGEGNLHAVSPVCTHLGCDLAWNSAERSWDCPCHGSRFDFRGKVLQGPAVEDLRVFL
jgi:Rieske Fe-S protein